MTSGSSNRRDSGTKTPGDRHAGKRYWKRVRARDRASARDKVNAREAGNWVREVDAATSANREGLSGSETDRA